MQIIIKLIIFFYKYVKKTRERKLRNLLFFKWIFLWCFILKKFLKEDNLKWFENNLSEVLIKIN